MSALPRRPPARIALIWGLVVALVIYGSSGVLLQMLGPMHRHADTAQAAPGLLAQRFTELATAASQWHDRLLSQALFVHERERFLPSPRKAQLHEESPRAHAHSHGPFERHHHDAADTSVLSLDSAAADSLSSASALGSASLPMCSPPVLALPAAAGVCADWLRAPPPRWRNAELALLERPPQA